jgi:hypothetical protein
MLKADDRGEVLLPVYRADAEPGIDRQGDTIGPADLFGAMARWAAKRQLAIQHADPLPDGLVTVLGCYMTGGAYQGDGYSIKGLTWVLHLRVDLDQKGGPELWRRLKDGDLAGLSIGGTATVEAFIEGNGQ